MDWVLLAVAGVTVLLLLLRVLYLDAVETDERTIYIKVSKKR